MRQATPLKQFPEIVHFFVIDICVLVETLLVPRLHDLLFWCYFCNSKTAVRQSFAIKLYFPSAIFQCALAGWFVSCCVIMYGICYAWYICYFQKEALSRGASFAHSKAVPTPLPLSCGAGLMHQEIDSERIDGLSRGEPVTVENSKANDPARRRLCHVTLMKRCS